MNWEEKLTKHINELGNDKNVFGFRRIGTYSPGLMERRRDASGFGEFVDMVSSYNPANDFSVFVYIRPPSQSTTDLVLVQIYKGLSEVYSVTLDSGGKVVQKRYGEKNMEIPSKAPDTFLEAVQKKLSENEKFLKLKP
ncbi:MAG: hypothetical protein J4452_03685 [Candidatus Aenigmarchaeota archaeon]|nr:hypothetical protein [Candidatus Aenigmarchaeota archaeon]